MAISPPHVYWGPHLSTPLVLNILISGATFGDANEARDMSGELGQIQVQRAQPVLGPLWEAACPDKAHHLGPCGLLLCI